MKKFIYLFVTLVLSSCVDQASSNIEFTLFNQTAKSVKLLGFIRDFDNPENSVKADPINIESNSNFKVTRISGIDNDTHMSFYSLKNGGVDSVRVIFNDEKVLVLTLESTFNQGQTIFQGNDEYQHFITEQDYQKADDCIDDCE
jgi:hypothetical protein